MMKGSYATKEDRKRSISLMAFTCWHIWKARCKAVFNHQNQSPSQTIHAINCDCSIFRTAKELTRIQQSLGLENHSKMIPWSPPSSQMIKVNVDASWKLRCNEAEAKAVLQGCLSAKQRNYPWIIVEFDSKQICKWSWVPRSANEAANFVATYVGTKMSEECRIDRPPSSLVRILNKDGLRCPPL
ncbi:hypothetical protein FF1_000025 [Malus domestica]